MRPYHPSLLHLMAACIFTAALFAVPGCSTEASLTQGERLYTGAEVRYEHDENFVDRSVLEEQMERLMVPAPNSSFLGLFRWKLWLYDHGIFTTSLGEPPVLFSAVSPERVTASMQRQLENTGHFRSVVRYTVNTSEHSADLLYVITLAPAYTITGVTVTGSIPLADTIRSVMEGTLIMAGERYDLDALAAERVRIAAALREKGYFYFTADDIVFRADSTDGTEGVRLSLELAEHLTEQASSRYTIGRITIHSGYALNRDTLSAVHGDTTVVEGCTFIDLDHEYGPSVIVRSVQFASGQPYNSASHDATLNRLMNLGIHTFVNIRFTASRDSGRRQLDADIYLTPRPTKNIQFELQGVSKSNNLAGPELNATFRNRNAFGGAELLSLSAETGFELPVSSGRSGGSSFVLGLRGALDLPKFILPFSDGAWAGRFVPRTHITAGVRMLERLKYYRMISISSTFGYVWRISDATEHQFDPFSVTYAKLASTTPEFRALIAGNPLLRRSFEEQFIIGQQYAYRYSDRNGEEERDHLSFTGTIDLSGTILSLLQSFSYHRAASPAAPYTIFHSVYSQFAKVGTDLRYELRSGDGRSSIASRLIVGLGIPFGNSASLPYVKQFSVGGSSSIRAFIARSVGPGSYAPPADLPVATFIDQAGDMTLEANVDYRIPVYGIVQGAFFADAGNIWLLRNDDARPGGMFSGGRFLSEIAGGAGAGIRLDLSFLLLRFDLAVPLRIPSLPVEQRWRFGAVDFGSAAWRRDNLVLNIAIGYPF